MKFGKLLFFAAVAGLLVASLAMADGNVQQIISANAGATIKQPLTLTATTSLEFGDIVMDDAQLGGTAIIAACSPYGPTLSGNLEMDPSPTYTPAAGEFQVTGEGGETILVSIWDPDIGAIGAGTIRISFGVNNMTIDQLTICDHDAAAYLGAAVPPGSGAALGQWTGTIFNNDGLPGADDADFAIGGRLTINAGQASGRYLGQYTARVEYY